MIFQGRVTGVNERTLWDAAMCRPLKTVIKSVIEFEVDETPTRQAVEVVGEFKIGTKFVLEVRPDDLSLRPAKPDVFPASSASSA